MLVLLLIVAGHDRLPACVVFGDMILALSRPYLMGR